MDDEAAFGNWLAGFIDGEGCFILRETTADYFRCGFSIELRVDDAPIIEEIQTRLGIGTIKYRHRPGKNGNDCPQVSWNVQSQPQCVVLMELLDRHPLRAKKAHDFAIWRMALKAQCTRAGVEILRAYKERLSAIKEFEGGEEIELPPPSQLRLIS
jgi:LAGLIDADG endonuclease